MDFAFWIALAVVALVGFWLVGAYNGLVRLRNRVRAAWSQIDVQLKRRYDLIPNLVNAVKGYMAHEKGVFDRIATARSAAMEAKSIPEKGVAEGMLTGALRQLFALVENYPDLKANQNVMSLQEELTATENRISFARQHYNDEAMTYNTRTESFPTLVIAGAFRFGREPFFEVEDKAHREPVKVEF